MTTLRVNDSEMAVNGLPGSALFALGVATFSGAAAAPETTTRQTNRP